MQFTTQIKGLDGLYKKLKAAAADKVIQTSLRQAGITLADWSKRNRLTGSRPRYLGVVTGRLRSSITASKPEKTGNGWQVRVGTNVKYAAVHEFGFRGAVNVRSFMRRGRQGEHLVKSHTRRMNMRARPFLRPSLEARTNQIAIEKIFSDNIKQALEKAK